MRDRNLDLLLVLALAILAASAGMAAQGSGLLVAAPSIPFVLILPGYALLAALLPRKGLGFAEVAALSLGLSIALVALGGLLLDFIKAGLGSNAWRSYLLMITTASVGVALVRRDRLERLAARGHAGRGHAARGHAAPPLPDGELAAEQGVFGKDGWFRNRVWARAVGSGRDDGWFGNDVWLRNSFLLLVAAVLIGVVFGLGVGPFDHRTPGDRPFTQFWALPRQEDSGEAVRIGLTNSEGERMSNRVTLSSGDYLLAEWPNVTLPEGDAWEVQAHIPDGVAGELLVATVYRERDPAGEPYRTLNLRSAGNSP
jgi:hypothetical protein